MDRPTPSQGLGPLGPKGGLHLGFVYCGANTPIPYRWDQLMAWTRTRFRANPSLPASEMYTVQVRQRGMFTTHDGSLQLLQLLQPVEKLQPHYRLFKLLW